MSVDRPRVANVGRPTTYLVRSFTRLQEDAMSDAIGSTSSTPKCRNDEVKRTQEQQQQQQTPGAKKVGDTTAAAAPRKPATRQQVQQSRDKTAQREQNARTRVQN